MEEEKKCNCHQNSCSCEQDCECKIDDKKTKKEKKKDKFEVLQEQANGYLDMAQRLQADFENFRRRSQEQIIQARIDGKISIIETFLPCLDTFTIAKKNISDEKTLMGVVMIEEKILSTLNGMGVHKISSIGEKYDANLHEVITVMTDEEKENDIILEEFQAGYKYDEKVIRYAKVIVNKKEEI